MFLEINRKLQKIHREILDKPDLNQQELEELVGRQEALGKLKQAVSGSPNWPFMNLASIIKALATAISPLVYLVFSKVVESYIIPWLESPVPPVS